MTKHLFAAFLLAGPLLFAQPSASITEGTWRFTVESYTATVDIAMVGPLEFEGNFVSASGKTYRALTGHIYTSLSRKADVTITWDSANRDVPGVNGGYLFLGNFTNSGKGIEGRFAVTPSGPAAGLWNAALVTPTSTDGGSVPGGNTPSGAPATCKLATGAYGYLLSGFYLANGVHLPFAAAGQLTVDAAGKLSASDTASFAGEMAYRTLNGDYAMDSGCSGHLQLTDGSSKAANLRFVIVGAGKRIQFVQSDSGWTVSGSGEAQ